MTLSPTIRVNSASCTYVPDTAFTTEKSVSIVGVYDTCLKVELKNGNQKTSILHSSDQPSKD